MASQATALQTEGGPEGEDQVAHLERPGEGDLPPECASITGRARAAETLREGSFSPPSPHRGLPAPCRSPPPGQPCLPLGELAPTPATLFTPRPVPTPKASPCIGPRCLGHSTQRFTGPASFSLQGPGALVPLRAKHALSEDDLGQDTTCSFSHDLSKILGK